MDTVFVVTGFELGWDCVVGVYTGISFEELLKEFPEEQYHINEQSVYDYSKKGGQLRT